MSALLCGAKYRRPDGTFLACQYLAQHPTDNHSWFAVQAQDDADRETDRAKPFDYTPAIVRNILGAIAAGDLDLYLEALLAVAHNRKRTLRNTWGFPDPVAREGKR